MEIINKNIILTGAASGIGRALLEQLSALPCRILAVDMNPTTLEEACSTLTGKPATVTPFICDLSSRENIDRLFDEALLSLDRVELFFANAGFAYYEQIEQPDWEHIEKIYRVNVFNTIYTIEKMHALFPNEPYRVVVTASAMAFIAVPGYAIYSSTKAALDRFVDGYRWQMKDPHKLVMVYPIGTQTGFFRAAGHNVPEAWPTQTPEEVARAIMRGVKKNQQTVYPSRLFSFIMFLDRFLPMHRLEQSMEQKRLVRWLTEKTGDKKNSPPG